MLTYLTYIFGGILLFLSFFFMEAYLANHTYYFDMLSNSSNWWIVILGLVVAFIPVGYVFFSRKKSLKVSALLFLISLIVFSWILGMFKGGFVGGGMLMLLINYLIVLFYWFVIILGFVSLGNLILGKLTFKRKLYDFAVKLAFGLALFGFLLYFIVVFQFLTLWISYILFALLAGLAFYQRKYLVEVFRGIEKEIKELVQIENKFIKYSFVGIFTVALWYIFVGFNYSFIPYPTAWDANHAYMFVPRVFGLYDGYPWNTDFRPDFYIWYGFLAWVFKLGSWTWFSSDTWMINFNFISGIFALYFGFMLISTLVRFLEDKKFLQTNKYFLLIAGYVLLLARLTSGNGAFLVFVDNKTDIAVLMFVILALFLLLYAFSVREELSDKLNNYKKSILVLIAISGFFFGIANLIKPTATFDFFEATLTLTILEIGFLAVIGFILFVVGLLAFLKFRYFDKAVPPSLGFPLMGVGSLLALINVGYKFFKNKFKIALLLVFGGSFIFTILITKGVFGLLQQVHDKNVNFSPNKVLPALVMSNKFPTYPKQELTGALFENLKEPVGDSYIEDNLRYVGYGNKDFGNPWWGFLIPSIFKQKACLVFNSISTGDCVVAKPGTNLYDKLLTFLAVKIYNNKDEKLFKEGIKSVIPSDEAKLKQLAKQLGLDENLPMWKLRKEVEKKLIKNTEIQLLLKLKQNLAKGNLNLSSYEKIFQTPENKKLFEELKTKPYVYESISIPYKYLVPFNVVLNWSLQNLTSYYTDIGIIWLFLFFVVLFSLIYGLYLLGKGFIRKKQQDIEYGKYIFAFAFSTLVGWGIWYFVASGIIWYNIGGIIWLIITTVLFLGKWKDKYLLWGVLMIVSVISIGLNLIRIASQGGGMVQTWYRSSVGKVPDYKIVNGSIQYVPKIKFPFGFDDVFSMQFNMYKLPIESINARKNDEMAIIGGTYMRYFVKNQNKINNDQFLMWLWKMGSDNSPENTYKRFKLYKLTDIVIDPNIASVVMGTGNISLWYRYFGKVDENGNIIEKGVLPMFVDLAETGHIEYKFSNNLGLKYALIYTDEQLSKILGINDLKQVRKIRYYLTSLRYIPRSVGFQYPDSKIGEKMYQEGMEALLKILAFRINEALRGNPYLLAEDIRDINGLYIKDLSKVIVNQINPVNFAKRPFDEKVLLLQLLNIVNQAKNQNSSAVYNLVQQSLTNRAQLLFVKVKG